MNSSQFEDSRKTTSPLVPHLISSDATSHQATTAYFGAREQANAIDSAIAHHQKCMGDEQ